MNIDEPSRSLMILPVFFSWIPEICYLPTPYNTRLIYWFHFFNYVKIIDCLSFNLWEEGIVYVFERRGWFLFDNPGSRFLKDPVTYRARKAILETMIRLPWKAALLVCFRYKKRQNNCQVSKLETCYYWRYKGIFVTRKVSERSRHGPQVQIIEVPDFCFSPSRQRGTTIY